MGVYTDNSQRPKSNIVEALMGREKTRSQSSPAAPHRRKKKQPSVNDSKQRTIKAMWKKDQEEEEGNVSLEFLESTNNRSLRPRMTAAEKGDDSFVEKSSN